MLIPFPLHFASPPLLTLAMISAAAVVMTAWRRKVALPLPAALLIAAGLFLVALASGEPVWFRPQVREIPVYVDISPSTRSAGYRDRAALIRRVHELLGSRPFHLRFFADGLVPESAAAAARFADAPARRTVFTPEAAPAAILFSDGRFELPAYAPPIFGVIDPTLESTGDAAVTALNIRGSDATATIHNRRGASRLEWDGVEGLSNERAPVGSFVLARVVGADVKTVAAAFLAGDLWPENDALSVAVPPPAELERWWVGATAPAGWRHISPRELPTDLGVYLAASVVVLDDLSLDQLSIESQHRLQQFVRDLGGGLVILGGRHAFGGGGYTGTPLDALSPLASDPPTPVIHWILLLDASGSMSADSGGGRSRWSRAVEAAAALPPHLPPNDRLSVGQFAERLGWWARGVAVRDASQLRIPPADARPHGPTNLRASLEAFIASADDAMQKELLLVTDAAAELGDVEALAAELRSRKTRLHALLIEPSDEVAPLRRLVALTGGDVREEAAPERWTSALREVMRAASPSRVNDAPISVQFRDALASLAVNTASPWNRTWLKQGALLLADGDAAGERVPLAASWTMGFGGVVASGFQPDPASVEALSRLVAAAPRDPRFKVNWLTGSTLHVTVEAMENGRFLNDQPLELTLATAAGAVELQPIAYPIPQSAPGRYEVSVDSPSEAAIASVRLGRRMIDRLALAGRYPPEFDAVGNDREALRRLATQSGGRVIEPTERRPIEIPWPLRRTSISPAFALVGAALILAGLLRWRRGEVR